MSEKLKDFDHPRSGKSINIFEVLIVEYLCFDGEYKQNYFSLQRGVASNSGDKPNQLLDLHRRHPL